MRSRLYFGKVGHQRLVEQSHRFEYPSLYFVLDVDELNQLDKELSFFGYNKKAWFSIFDSDYLSLGQQPLREKVEKQLLESGLREKIERIELVTQPRFMNKVFNPVSFFYCYRPNGSLAYLMAEVHNTFKEKHLYVVQMSPTDENKRVSRGLEKKCFHVSPFFDRKGEYEFITYPLNGTMNIQVNLMHDGEHALRAGILGYRQELSGQSLWKVLLKYPFMFWSSLWQIHKQAGLLYFVKRLRYHPKRGAISPMTFTVAPPKLRDRFCMRFIFSFLGQINQGCLTLELPDKSFKTFGNTHDSLQAKIEVKDYRFFRRLFSAEAVGFGEGYTAGDWSSPDLIAVLDLLISNQVAFNSSKLLSARLGRWINSWRHRLRPNSLLGSRSNIQAHYDLSNTFFQTFLDPSMTYSSACFRDPTDSLAQAQKHKLHKMIVKANITQDSHVLEIGSGWGSFAIEAVKQTGCRVTTITVSQAQYDLASERIANEGLTEKIDLRLCDYRKIEGQYDAIVSIEMLEAVGHRYFSDYFKSCERLLKPQGVMALQVITIPDQRYERYRRSCDWIQKYIFPGGHLPSLTSISEVLTRDTQLTIQDLENIGDDYAKTLSIWRSKFHESLPAHEAMNISEEQRLIFDYYFAYCQAGFQNRIINTLQIVLSRAGNKSLKKNRTQEGAYL